MAEVSLFGRGLYFYQTSIGHVRHKCGRETPGGQRGTDISRYAGLPRTRVLLLKDGACISQGTRKKLTRVPSALHALCLPWRSPVITSAQYLSSYQQIGIL
jgi:hypothetical protein